MPENPTGLPAVFNGKSAGSAADDASGAAETPAAAPVAAAGVALSGDARRDAESNDATCCGPNDSINTVAARSCSPHSTTPPQAASTSHKKLLLQRADAAQLRQAAAAVEEQRQQDQPAEAEDQSNVSSALQLQRCLAAVVKLSAAVSGAEGGERVLACIANLLAGLITVEEFQLQVHELVRLPFRSFVVPFLKKQVPMWQVEIANWNGESAQTSSQWVRHQVKYLLDCSEAPSSDLNVWDIFLRTEASPARKRRASSSIVESGTATEASMSTATTASAPAPKRTHTASLLCGSDATPERPVDAFWPASRASWPEAQQPSQGVLHLASPHRSPPTLSTLNGTAVKNVPSNAPSCNPLTAGSPTRQPYGAAEIASASKLSNQPPEEEWVNIHTMLNCILSMVEKTRKALAILQHRAATSSYDKSDNLPLWKRGRSNNISSNYHHNHHHEVYEVSELRRQAGELIAQTLRATEDRVSEVKRKAEEAVYDVKRSAMAELHKALVVERARAERLVAEARRQGAEETLLALGRHSHAKEVCWNCNRRANETCSGCKIARYCSTLCQHKHWEIHHKICGRVSQLILKAAGHSSPNSGGGGGGGEPHELPSTAPAPATAGPTKSSKSPSPVQGSFSN